MKVVDVAPSFPYFQSPEFLDEKAAGAILTWFTQEARGGSVSQVSTSSTSAAFYRLTCQRQYGDS